MSASPTPCLRAGSPILTAAPCLSAHIVSTIVVCSLVPVLRTGYVSRLPGPSPTAPDGKASNWPQTVPGKGFFVILRLYNPLQPFFDKTWRPSEIEKI